MYKILPDEIMTESRISTWKSCIQVLPNGCWDYSTGKAKDNCGYNLITIGKSKHYQAHRFSYQLYKGTQDLDKFPVLHKCGNEYCMNPEHLYLGTQEQNMKDRFTHGRHNRHNKDALARAEEIRQKFNTGLFFHSELAKEYGLSQSAICRIVNKKRWNTQTTVGGSYA